MGIRLEKNYLQRSPVRNEHGQKAEYKRTINCYDFYLSHFLFLLKIFLLSCIIHFAQISNAVKMVQFNYMTKNRCSLKNEKWYSGTLIKA
jgi:hypothetical protein